MIAKMECAGDECRAPRHIFVERFDPMCRNIKTLFNFDPPVTDDEVRSASLQFVRKISGFTKPSKANEAAFAAAVEEIADISSRLLQAMETTAPPKNREEEAAKAKARTFAVAVGCSASNKRHIVLGFVTNLRIRG